jgi:DNA-binding PadR family transcriptional regulator
VSRNDELTDIERLLLLAVLRLHPHGYGVSIRDEIEARTKRQYSFGTIYTTLDRLEQRGYVKSREGEATAARGGRKKLHYELTGEGNLALERSLAALDAMRAGIGWKGAVA